MSRQTHCAACGSHRTESFYAVGDIPIQSCRIIATRAEARSFPRRDLELAFCADCGFIRNRLFDPDVLRYDDRYEDTQAHSGHFMAFLEGLADRQIARHGLNGKTVLEIGCGGGDFLAMLCRRGGCRGIGIDPSYRAERQVEAATLDVIPDLFGPAHLDLPADYVCCRHTLEHVADPRAFVELTHRLLDRRSDVPVFFEVPDTLRILTEGAFWDIYYEHCNYFTAGSLARLFRRAGFDLIELDLTYQGQYLLLEGASGPARTPPLPYEDDLATVTAAVESFRVSMAERLQRLRHDLDAWANTGQRVVLWGASSKAVAYLSGLGVGDEVAAVADINPKKRGMFLAGSGHPIVHPDDLPTLPPDVVVLTNPVYAREIEADLANRGLHPTIVAL